MERHFASYLDLTPDSSLTPDSNLRAHGVEMLTIGQYLQPTRHHLPVVRFVEPAQFDRFTAAAEEMGFANAACGPMVRSSYHADRQAKEAGIAVK